MTKADLVRADQQAMLIVGTFVAAQQDPQIWERFINRMFDEWSRESAADAAARVNAANQAIAAFGRLAAGSGAQSGVDAAASDNDAQHAPAPVSSPPTAV